MQEESRTEPDSYRVILGGNWDLYDLHEFPYALSQCYAFIYCLDSKAEISTRKRIDSAFRSYPWHGGYSYVNIYTVLQNQIPLLDRPKVKSISYASPGWLDIFLNVEVAKQIAASLGMLLGSAVAAAKAYAQISKTLSGTKIEKEKTNVSEMQLAQERLKIAISMCDDLANFLGFRNVKELHQRTGNPEISLKLLLAHYRRMRVLVEYVQNGQAVLPEGGDDKSSA